MPVLVTERARLSGVLIDLFDTLVPLATQSRMTGPIDASIRAVCATIGHVPADDRLASAMTTRLHLQKELLAHPREDAVQVLKTLRARGLRVAVLSNCSSDTADAWARCGLSPPVDSAVMSAAEGACKPDPRVYELALERLRLRAPECLFVDDNATYLGPAAELGIRAVQFRASEAV